MMYGIKGFFQWMRQTNPETGQKEMGLFDYKVKKFYPAEINDRRSEAYEREGILRNMAKREAKEGA